jgi:hypothetical protein
MNTPTPQQTDKSFLIPFFKKGTKPSFEKDAKTFASLGPC